MNKQILTFAIDNHEKFVIHADSPDDIIDCCYQAPIILYANLEEIIIAHEDIQEYAERLHALLPFAVTNLLQLDPSIQKNIGCY